MPINAISKTLCPNRVVSDIPSSISEDWAQKAGNLLSRVLFDLLSQPCETSSLYMFDLAQAQTE